ncbi:MAG: DoxX family protein [Vicinamibacterales bacterium]
MAQYPGQKGGAVNGLGLAVLRLALATVFVAHGAHILFGLWPGPGIGTGGLDLTAQAFAATGLAPAFPLAVVTGIIETVGGVLIAIGWFTRVAAPLLAIVICVAIWKVQLAYGFFLNWMGAGDRGQGYEYSLILLGALICLSFTGSGEWSIDGQREASRASRQAGRARLRGKL